MLKALCISVLVLLSSVSSGQGLLRSVLVGLKDTAVVCTLSVRSFDRWDSVTYHYFRQSTATYFAAGDYVIHYQIDTVYIHQEWIHFSHKWSTLYKYVLTERIPLHKVRFMRPRRRSDWEEGVIYLDF